MGIRIQRLAALTLSFLAAPTHAATIRGTVAVPEGLPGAANAVVYIEQIPGKTFEPTRQPLVMDQHGYTYRPHVLPVVVGSTVEFPNNDPDAHNTYSSSDCCRFNLGTYPTGQKRSVKFEKAGVAEILCNIHPQMGAYVLALQNPYFAVTDAGGHFEMCDVPAGYFTLVVWHEVLPSLRRQVHVGTTDLEVNLALKSWSPPSANQPAEEMVFIPAGTFVMGADDRFPNEKPRRTVASSTFWIDRTEVTNAEFCDFLNALRRNREDGGVTWIDLDNPACKISAGKKHGEFVVEHGFEKYPAVCVSWHGASAYAQWLGKRLPTEAEWEKAARGTDGREWPWGNQFGSGNANVRSTAALPVGSFTGGMSSYGCLDMAGNVWEWTASDDTESIQKIIRGGAFDSLPTYARCSVRIAASPTLRSAHTGFRCARDTTQSTK